MKVAGALSRAEINRLVYYYTQKFGEGNPYDLNRGDAQDYAARIWYAAVTNLILEDKDSTEAKLKIALDFIDKIAGPVGSGCDLSSRQYMAQQVRSEITGVGK